MLQLQWENSYCILCFYSSGTGDTIDPNEEVRNRATDW